MATPDRRHDQFAIWPNSAAAAVVVIALIVLTGWLLDLPSMRSFSPGKIEMKILTAIAFLFAGAALLLLVPNKRVTRRLGHGAAVTILTMRPWCNQLHGQPPCGISRGRRAGPDSPRP